MGKRKKPGASLLFPTSKFIHLATLARRSTRKVSRSAAPVEAVLLSSESGDSTSAKSTTRTDVGPSSSSDLVLDADLLSPVVSAPPQIASEAEVVVACPPSDTSPPFDQDTKEDTVKHSVSDHERSSRTGSSRLLADRIKDSSLLEELGTPTTHVSGVPFVLIPDDNITTVKEEFKEFLFARFPGDVPPMGRIIGVVNAIWARSGPRIFVHDVGQGTFLFKVTSEKTRGLLLSRQAWMIAGCPMFIAPWSPEFSSEESQLTSAVVPVEFRGVPYLLFNRQSLSRIATAVGKPVSLAPETERKENFEVAKLPTKVISGYSNGRENEILVSYPWLPKRCAKCEKFGHDQHLCPSTLLSGRTHDESNNFRSNQKAARFRSREPNNMRRSRPSRAQRALGNRVFMVKEPATDKERQPSFPNQSQIEKTVCPSDTATLDDGDLIKSTDVVNEGNLVRSCAESTLVGDFCNPQITVKDWAMEVEIVSLDCNMGFSTVHVYHEEDGSNSASIGDRTDDFEAPFFLVPNRKRLNSNTRHTSVKEWIDVNKPLFGAYLETRIQPNNSRRISGALPTGWKFFANSEHHDNARIIVVWHPSITVTIYQVSAQVVTCGIFILAENLTLTVSFVYAFNQVEERRQLWDELTTLNATTPVSRCPWAVVGDFNQILRAEKHSNYLHSEVDSAGIEDFNVAIQDAELFESQSNGLPHSWLNNQDASPVAKKIDHALINQHWAERFPDAYCEFLEPGQSDHAPCLFRMPSFNRRIIKPFKFFHHTIDHPEFLETVRTAWNCMAIQGSLQFKIARSLNTRHYSGISLRVKDQAAKVTLIRRQLLTSPVTETAAFEHRERAKWQMLAKAEEKFYRQKSRVRWHGLGDRDTTFYHNTVVHRANRNHIHFLKDSNDNQIGSTEGIKLHAAEYFTEILGCTDMPESPITIEQLKTLMSFRCSEEQGHDLQKEFKRVSGLEMNPKKSEIFFGGYQDIEASVLSDLSGFKLGTFPTRYLGLPLKPGKRLFLAALQPLIDKIASKLQTWTDFETVFRLKRVWTFFTSSGSIWVAWLRNHTFKRLGFWLTLDSNRLSTTIRSMLQLRSILKEFMHCSIGDGATASFWYDSWTTLGPLIDYAGEGGLRSLCIRKTAKVAEASIQGSWTLPAAHSNSMQTIQEVITTVEPPKHSKGEDTYRWRKSDGTFGPIFFSRIKGKESMCKLCCHMFYNIFPRLSFFPLFCFKKKG
ncbi:hypothetical protein Bca52824_014791 [Brassica carinata]|uniref:DUF4283 domain-containing protein n=1 Tax=Brassica carinata TaxID=52824 RepID=A0A8X8B4S4_BRACI|nr:hypothetical protein Bca52824_014791 [Brassica carinata]